MRIDWHDFGFGQPSSCDASHRHCYVFSSLFLLLLSLLLTTEYALCSVHVTSIGRPVRVSNFKWSDVCMWCVSRDSDETTMLVRRVWYSVLRDSRRPCRSMRRFRDVSGNCTQEKTRLIKDRWLAEISTRSILLIYCRFKVTSSCLNSSCCSPPPTGDYSNKYSCTVSFGLRAIELTVFPWSSLFGLDLWPWNLNTFHWYVFTCL